ncbi:LLM class F420-dependent oxidoreductase [Nocardioides sp. Root190]|uniref:LLM class flavin-dependent oxidoreductase n=1 Tax=Nocardioides sp. Root190 TaxID=1736488 RepID=UPI0007009585|nr:LLM class flavin-dependent oxidoreductase [Nocardioides sp. Root190]KRB73277.1 LLM class F420-dependent oxidoreductase [Nocardioides sp. Root190]
MEIIASWPASSPLGEVAGWAQRVEALGFDVLHVPETIHDPFTVAALALASTSTLTVRTSMVVAFARSPMLTAYSAWDLARFSDGRFELGLASQVRGNIVGRYSAEWSEPVARLGDYISAVRAIFRSFQTGAELDHDGPHYRFTRLQPYFNPGPLDTPAPTLWSGGVNRGMCELAGRLSDGFVCHPTNSHPAMIRSVIQPAIDAGRTATGRAVGPRLVAGPQPIMAATTAELQAVRDSRRAELAFLYSTPAYRPQLDLFGLGDLAATLSGMAAAVDWSGLEGHLTDDVIDRLVPQGTFDTLPDVLEQWYSGLCDGIVLGIPEAADDTALTTLVERCRAIS